MKGSFSQQRSSARTGFPAEQQGEERAIRVARSLAMKHVGVIAWSREANPAFGEYGPPTTLFQAGEIPDMKMGDEIRLSTEHRAPSGLYVHYCERAGSKEWGGWGYSRTEQETRWFCYEHRGDGEAMLVDSDLIAFSVPIPSAECP